MIHFQYQRLNNAARNGVGAASIRAEKAVAAIDEIMTKAFDIASKESFKLDGSDPAERVAEALARWFIESSYQLAEDVDQYGRDA